MRNKLTYFFLVLLSFTAKSFAAQLDTPCDWVDQEALAALGLTTSVPKEGLVKTGTQDAKQCTFAIPATQTPWLSVIARPSTVDLVLKPVCDWSYPPSSGIQLGVCVMNVGSVFLAFTYNVSASSASGMESTFSDQIERLYNKHMKAAAK